ncbi:MAG: dephospho-CoA kinase [Actinomycetota bacterium]|nr:dephospho-CoA kinase [Actinomycetota bacterium]
MLRVGLTGGIGSGKSEVSRRLATRGAIVIDADLLAREVVAAGSDGFAEVVAVFGPDVVGADGELDRAALGRQVFGDRAARHRLEQIVHPRVRLRAAEIEAEIEAGIEAGMQPAAGADVVVVHDVPLLVETGRQGDFDVVVVVDASDEVRRDRLVSGRGMDPDEARGRIASQAGRAERLAAADLVVGNGGDLADLDAAVDVLWLDLLARTRS